MPLSSTSLPLSAFSDVLIDDADMQMIYDSDAFCVVKIDLPAVRGPGEGSLSRGGYEIVDKLARKEIFLEGAMAASFQDDVQALIGRSPSVEEIDDYLGRFSSLMQHPLALH